MPVALKSNDIRLLNLQFVSLHLLDFNLSNYKSVICSRTLDVEGISVCLNIYENDAIIGLKIFPH